MSVYIEAIRPSHANPDEDLVIIQGTGFVLEHGGERFLVTNGHIVTGRERTTDKPLRSAALPRQLRVAIPVVGGGLGTETEPVAILGTRTATLDLYDEAGEALWFCHPTFGRRVDVVAVSLGEPNSQFPDLRGTYLPYRLPSAPLTLEPPHEVSIVGFPYGLRGGASTAIWVRGTVATEPDFPYEGESCFLVDARTRKGQSGSPVIQFPVDVPDVDDNWNLLGVYSSRIEDSSTVQNSTDLGRVWTADSVRSVVEAQSLDDLVYE